MYEKIKKFNEKIVEGKFAIRCICILIIFMCALIIYLMDDWQNVFYYPEQEYKVLEDEVKKMIYEQNFETNYKYRITLYDNTSKTLNINLMNSDVYIDAYVDNFGSKDANITIIRKDDNINHQILKYFIAFFVLSTLLALWVYLLFILLSLSVLFIAFIAQKLKNKIKK